MSVPKVFSYTAPDPRRQSSACPLSLRRNYFWTLPAPTGTEAGSGGEGGSGAGYKFPPPPPPARQNTLNYVWPTSVPSENFTVLHLPRWDVGMGGYVVVVMLSEGLAQRLIAAIGIVR